MVYYSILQDMMVYWHTEVLLNERNRCWGVAAFFGVGWERSKEEPSTDRR